MNKAGAGDNKYTIKVQHEKLNILLKKLSFRNIESFLNNSESRRNIFKEID